MCLFNTPQMPVQAAAAPPRTPQPDSFQAQQASDEARRLAAARSGSQANLVSDLKSSDVASSRPVLSPVKAVMLGQ
jgi:hypothetical protein